MHQASRCMQVIPSAWLRLFNPKEVNELLSGGEGGGVDAQDMQRHATYSGGYSADSQTIRLFWKVGTTASFHLTKVAAQPCSPRGRARVRGEQLYVSSQMCSKKSEKSKIGQMRYPQLCVLPCKPCERRSCTTGGGRPEQSRAQRADEVCDLCQPSASGGVPASHSSSHHSQGVLFC